MKSTGFSSILAGPNIAEWVEWKAFVWRLLSLLQSLTGSNMDYFQCGQDGGDLPLGTRPCASKVLCDQPGTGGEDVGIPFDEHKLF